MILSFFLSGVGAATFGLAALFFLKFWRVSQDRLFFHLSTACALLCLERVVGLIIYIALPSDDVSFGLTRSWIYLIRLVSFLLIIYAVVQKNRSADNR